MKKPQPRGPFARWLRERRKPQFILTLAEVRASEWTGCGDLIASRVHERMEKILTGRTPE